MSTTSQSQMVAGSKVPTVIAYLVVILASIVMAAPYVWMLLTSFTEEVRIFRNPPSFWPNPWVWSNYVVLFRDAPLLRNGLNSTFIAVVTTIGLVSSCSLGAFSLARLRFPGRGFWFALILATLFVPGQVLLIPQYFVFRSLGWIDTFLPLIVPSFFGGAFGIFLLHQFFKGIPEELVDAARVDGANPFRIFFQIFVPLSAPAIVALAILQFLYGWNQFLEPLIYLNSADNYTYPLALTRFQSQYGTGYFWAIIMGGAFIGTIPSVMVYLLGQRYFVQGIILSGVKR